MANYIKFIDSMSFKVLSLTDEEKQDWIQRSTSTSYPSALVAAQNTGATTGLNIKIAATHAGKITRNNGFYLPHKMRDGASSWTSQYNKPILLHHDSHEDAIGRVIGARYVPTDGSISNIQNRFKDSAIYQPSVLDAFLNGTLPKRDLLDFANKHFIQDASVAEDPDYEGLGYIELLANISDPEAIQKLLDGRYLTGSVGASTNSATCSICMKDWAAEDVVCDHSPGKVYEGKKAVLIAGDLFYEEYSFVNKPADRHSKVIEVNVNGVRDFINVDESIKDAIIPEVSLSLIDQVTLPKEDKVMTREELLRDLLKEDYESVVGSDSLESNYLSLLASALQGDILDEDGNSLASEIKDKKLSAEARKKMSASTFCGPDRSYPVPDCSHAKVAMAYAKKYNESSSVVACIRRKAARLGCDFKDEVVSKKEITVGDFVLDYFDHFDDEQLAQLSLGLKNALKERNLDCNECQDIADKLLRLERELADAKSALETQSDTSLKDLQNELKDSYKNLESAQNEIKDLALALSQVKLQRVLDFKTLSGENLTDEVKSELNSKSEVELDDLLDSLTKTVNIKTLVDKVNSGLTQETIQETVENPVSIQDNTKPPEAQKEYNPEIVKKIAEKYLYLRLKDQRAALHYLDNMKTRGLIPLDYQIVK